MFPSQCAQECNYEFYVSMGNANTQLLDRHEIGDGLDSLCHCVCLEKAVRYRHVAQAGKPDSCIAPVA